MPRAPGLAGPRRGRAALSARPPAPRGHRAPCPRLHSPAPAPHPSGPPHAPATPATASHRALASHWAPTPQGPQHPHPTGHPADRAPHPPAGLPWPAAAQALPTLSRAAGVRAGGRQPCCLLLIALLRGKGVVPFSLLVLIVFDREIPWSEGNTAGRGGRGRGVLHPTGLVRGLCPVVRSGESTGTAVSLQRGKL